MMLSSLCRQTAAAGLVVLVLSIHLGNWAGYAWCKLATDSTAQLRDCGCDVYLSGTDGLPGSVSAMGNTSFKPLLVEGMPEFAACTGACADVITQRGLLSPSSRYIDPYTDPLFRPPGLAC